METVGSYDVAIVGGGIAGLVTANRAAELGLRCAVIEKGEAELYLCNSRFTGGFFHVCMQDIRSGAAKLKEILRAMRRDDSPSPIVDALATDAERGIQWMQAQGIRFIKAGPAGYMSTVLAPPGLRQTGLHWEGRGGDVMLRTLGTHLTERRNGKLIRATRAKRLVMEGDRCVGIEVEGSVNGIVRANAVVLADGGFQADLDRLRREISPRPELVKQRGAATGTGDGARMAEDVGARLVGLRAFYGHVLHLDALTNEKLWPYPVLDMVAASAILVDKDGKRFCDEGEGGIYQANAIAKLDDPSAAVVVFDQAIWDGPGREFLLPANPNLPNAGGEIIEASSIEQLADKLGLDAKQLNATVEAYNAACRQGNLAELSPPRRNDFYQPMPLVGPKFMAARVCAGLTYTMGGIATDEFGRVLHQQGNSIPGLYAVGSTTGGLEGGPHAGYSGGLSKALVFGLRAAETIAASVKKAA